MYRFSLVPCTAILVKQVVKSSNAHIDATLSRNAKWKLLSSTKQASRLLPDQVLAHQEP